MPSEQNLVKEIIINGNAEERKKLFSFSLSKDSNEKILFKFRLFVESQYIRYFESEGCDEHDVTLTNYLNSYRGDSCVEIGFRGYAKTTYMKLFLVFVVLNDTDNYRKYIKVLAKDLLNAKQSVTDVYNLMVEVRHIYGDMFEQEKDIKREETMGGFTTKDGVKVSAGQIGKTQRGNVQDAFRPDWIWFDDIEDAESITSIVQTEFIMKRADEAIQGLSFNGSWVLTANYISDAGVVQWFLDKGLTNHIVPIVDSAGNPTWKRYTADKIKQLKKDAFDWAGDYLCDPTRSGDKFFDIDKVERDIKNALEPISVRSGVSIWADYQSNHRYGGGMDLSDGVGKDSCAFTFFNFSTGEDVASYDSNTLEPDLFTHETMNIGHQYGSCIIAPEINNTAGGIAISTLREKDYPRIYRKEIKDSVGNTLTNKYGWHTNRKTKPEMFYAFKRDYEDGLIKIRNKRLLQEMKNFSKNDLQDAKTGAITRHFDLLISACIAWQMKDHADSGAGVKDFYRNLKSSGTKRTAHS